MGLTYGFYNSINGDRKYNANQLCDIFDGVINDGVFASVGDHMMVRQSDGMNVAVGTGRAWFNKTWTSIDSAVVVTVSAAESALARIDRIVLEVNNNDNIRANRILVIKGIPSTNPVAPGLTNTANVHQHALADIRISAGVTKITDADITNRVGTSMTPFVTAILQTTNIDTLYAQWESEFSQWFARVKETLDTNTVTRLQNQIDTLGTNKLDKSAKATNDEVQGGSNDTKYVTPKSLTAVSKTVFDTRRGVYVNAESFIREILSSGKALKGQGDVYPLALSNSHYFMGRRLITSTSGGRSYYRSDYKGTDDPISTTWTSDGSGSSLGADSAMWTVSRQNPAVDNDVISVTHGSKLYIYDMTRHALVGDPVSTGFSPYRTAASANYYFNVEGSNYTYYIRYWPKTGSYAGALNTSTLSGNGVDILGITGDQVLFTLKPVGSSGQSTLDLYTIDLTVGVPRLLTTVSFPSFGDNTIINSYTGGFFDDTYAYLPVLFRYTTTSGSNDTLHYVLPTRALRIDIRTGANNAAQLNTQLRDSFINLCYIGSTNGTPYFAPYNGKGIFLSLDKSTCLYTELHMSGNDDDNINVNSLSRREQTFAFPDLPGCILFGNWLVDIPNRRCHSLSSLVPSVTVSNPGLPCGNVFSNQSFLALGNADSGGTIYGEHFLLDLVTRK